MIRLPKSFLKKEKENKFKAKKCSEDGFKFDSLRERKRYLELKFLQGKGTISELTVHPVYAFTYEGKIFCKMLPDFRYMENGEIVIEDVKSKATITTVYRLKKKMLKLWYGLDVKEILR